MDFEQYLYFEHSTGILSCKHCQFAILPGRVQPHFADQHRDLVSPEVRRTIATKVQELVDAHPIAKRAYSDYSNPKDPCQPFSGLPVFRDSHRCLYCTYVVVNGTGAQNNMQKHLKTHNVFPMHKNARDEWYPKHVKRVFSQRFFLNVPHVSEYDAITSHFEVKRPTILSAPTSMSSASSTPSNVLEMRSPSHDANLPPSDTNSHNTHVALGEASNHEPKTVAAVLAAQILEAEGFAEQDRLSRNAAVPPRPSIQSNPWVAHLRYAEIFEQFSTWNEALQYIAIPKEKTEPKLFLLYSTVKSMVRTWQNVSASTSRYARIRVMQEDHTDVPTFPLEPYQDFDTKHAGPLQKIFIFFYRVLVQQLPKPNKLHLRNSQQRAWQKIAQALEDNGSEMTEIDCSHDRTELVGLEVHCHAFWLTLLQQTSYRDDFELAVLTPIAFLSLSPRGDGYGLVYSFATDLSALKKMARFAGLQYLQDTLSPPGSDEDDILTPAHPTQRALSREELSQLIAEQDAAIAAKDIEIEEQNRAVATDFKGWVYNYLTTEYPTPMDWLIQNARFLSRFRYGDNLDAFVQWNGDTVTIRRVRTTLAKFTSAVWNEYEAASSVLCSLAFVQQRDEFPNIPWNDMLEEPRKEDTGFSVFDPLSEPLRQHKGFIGKRLVAAVQERQQKAYADTFIDNLSDSKQVARYCEKVQEFLGHLLCLIHLTSGQPARGTELLSVQLENTSNNGMRNLYLFNGLVAVVPRYHKGYNRDKSVKSIFRFLPREVGSLLTWYLWIVRPFYTLILQQASPMLKERYYCQATSSLLWPSEDGRQRKTSQLLAKVLQRATERWMGQTININTMRHLMIAFARKIGGSDRLPKELSKEEVDELVDDAEAEAREMQAGHSAETAHAVYAVDVSKIFSRKFDMAEAHFKSSSDWHRALNFEPTDQDFDPTMEDRTTREYHQRLELRVGADLLKLLRTNFGDHARFRNSQQDALRAVMRGDAVVPYIAGTGSGKSLLFLLPACFPNYGQSIVIVPLAALRNDLVARCQRLRITATIWKAGDCNEAASIIFATPESIDNGSFVSLVRRLSAAGRLERLVVDEFHYVLLPDTSYRPSLLRLQSLAQYGVRITLLSATIPKEAQREAFRLLGVPSDLVAFRESTVRPNIGYEVRYLQDSIFDTNAMAQYFESEAQHHGKILVYVEFAGVANELADALQCWKFHGQLPSSEQRSNQFAYSAATAGIMIATSAFTAGMDVPDIRAVFRVARFVHLIQWSQESGRAGRDGKPALACVILGPAIQSKYYNEAEPSVQATVDMFIQEGVDIPLCRRQILDRYFDGNMRRRMCMAAEEKCDICKDRFYASSNPGYVLPVEENAAPTSASSSQYTPSHARGHTGTVQAIPRTPVREPRTPIHATSNSFRNVLKSPAIPSSSPYQLSTQPPRFGGISTGYTPTMRPLQESPTPLILSPKKHPRTSVDILSSPTSASPQKRVRVPQSSVNSLPSEGMDAEAVRFTASKQERELDHMVDEADARKSQVRKLFFESFIATQQYWISHCVICFADEQDFDHPRSPSCGYLGSNTQKYKGLLHKTYGRGQCWSCVMPANCCGKWTQPGTTRVLSQPRREALCVDKFAIADTWAYLWEHCDAVRIAWKRHIQDQGLPTWEDGNEKAFEQHFKSIVDYGEDMKAGQIILGLNWLTHTYFIGADQRPFVSTSMSFGR